MVPVPGSSTDYLLRVFGLAAMGSGAAAAPVVRTVAAKQAPLVAAACFATAAVGFVVDSTSPAASSNR